MKKILMVAGALALLGGCATDDRGREVGSILNPYCGPDGSVVRVIYPDKDGRYDRNPASPANCPWNKSKS